MAGDTGSADNGSDNASSGVGPAVLVSDPNAAYEFYVKEEERRANETIDEMETHINKIITNVYVGDIWAASNKDVLKKLNVTHIVCAAKHVEEMFPEDFEYLTIEIYDMDEVELKPHLLHAATFIETALRMGGRVLIHCMAGMSRSVSVCIAYLMLKKKVSFERALQIVKQARPIAEPNPGFVSQLSAFESEAHSMNFEAHVLDLLTEKPIPEPPPTSWFKCRKCRNKLLNNNQLIAHEPSTEPHEFYRKNVYGKKNNKAKDECSSWFVDEGVWMSKSNCEDIEGKLECPKCKTKVGSWCWSGAQCSCGHWETPSFQILKSRVDEVPVDQPVIARSLPPSERTTQQVAPSTNCAGDPPPQQQQQSLGTEPPVIVNSVVQEALLD